MADEEHERRFHEASGPNSAAADLSGCDLSGVNASSIRLAGARLRGADLRRADLPGGYFRGCDLRDAKLGKSRAPLGDFRGADLSGADLTAADWSGSVLSGANLAGADLRRACLVKVRLEGANLAGANLAGSDLRGAKGLTVEQLGSARGVDKAILDEAVAASVGIATDREVARLGKPSRSRSKPCRADLVFDGAKPSLGDLLLLCGVDDPKHPPTDGLGFAELAGFGVEQVDDYFAVCASGDPVVWIYPLVRGNVVEHHPGPYDGLRIEAVKPRHKKRWAECVTRFERALKGPPGAGE